MNLKLKYYLLGVLTCFLLGIFVSATGIILYMNGYFDDNGSGRIVIDRDDKEIYQPQIDDSILDSVEKEIEKNTTQEKNEKTITTETIENNKDNENKEIIKKQPEIVVPIVSETENKKEKNITQGETKVEEEIKEIKRVNFEELTNNQKNDLYFITLYDELNSDETKKKMLSFLSSYYLLMNTKFDLDYFKLYYYNIDIEKTEINFEDLMIKAREGYEKLEQDTSFSHYINMKKKEIIQDIKLKHDGGNGNLNIDTCFYKFCTEKKEEYNYIKKAIIHDQEYLKILGEIQKNSGLDSKIFLTIITIENLRMHSQYKGRFKAVFLKYRTPLLANMSQMSYGMYGTKANFVKRIINENYGNNQQSIFSIGDTDETLKYIKDTFFYFNQQKNEFEFINVNSFIDELIKDKKLQSNLIGSFLKITRQGWLTKELDLFQRKNIGYLLTLYNIGKVGEPKTNPEFGGATLDFLSTKYNFGELSNLVFNSLEMLDIEQQINKLMKHHTL